MVLINQDKLLNQKTTDAAAESTEVVQNDSDAANGSEQPEENATTSGATGKYLCVALLALCVHQFVF